MDNNFSKVKCSYQSINDTSYGRIGHRVVKLDNYVLMLGGINFKGNYATTIIRIDLSNYQINHVTCQNTLLIEGFSLFIFKNRIYLWGGTNNHIISNLLWTLSEDQYIIQQQYGQIPNPRTYHAYALFAQCYLIVYGGIGLNQQLCNDWFVLDLNTMRWHQCVSDVQLPFNIDAKMIVVHGRGFLLLNETPATSSTPNYIHHLYEFQIVDFTTFSVHLQLIVLPNSTIPPPRGNPSICPITINHTYIALLGGQKINQNINTVFSDLWLFSLHELKWILFPSLTLSTKYASQILSHGDRILSFGGVNGTNSLSNNVQIICFDFYPLQTKICRICSYIYALDQPYKTNISIKFQYDESFKVKFEPALIHKLSSQIRNPLNAFGLLLDNSLNMNATKTALSIHQVKTNPKYYKDFLQYLLIQDNSYGFSKYEIIQTLHTFGYKTQTLTHDNKFEQELSVRKQYGLNLKLAALRLGRSCLYVTKTLQDDLAVAYFSTVSTNCPNSSANFTCFYYFINQQGQITSQVNSSIILNNVKHLISPKQYHNCQIYNTKLYIMDLQISDHFENNLQHYTYNYGNGMILKHLKQYIQSLYLIPYFGRKIYLDDQQLHYCDYIHIFRCDENNGKLHRLNVENLNGYFQILVIYQILQLKYSLQQILIYHQNRFIMSIPSNHHMVCGIIQIPNEIQIDISKGKIQKLSDEKKLLELIDKIYHMLSSLTLKRQSQHPRIILEHRSNKKTKIIVPQFH